MAEISEIANTETKRIVDFLNAIGIECISATIDAETFLPGVLVESGRIFFEEKQLTYPGDLLHEAGHLALAAGDVRPTLSGEVILPDATMEAVEVYTMAWSYAAALYLEIEPTVVFHAGGYDGASARLLNNFTFGVYIGVNGLEDAGLTATGAHAAELGIPPYPHMIKWLRD